ASQKLTPQADRSLLAEFDLSNTEEIKRWLLSFGRHAEVIQPKTLRNEIADEARSMIAHYDISSPQSHYEVDEDKDGYQIV
ncbi:MAG: WYL domain-containing protein, partial [Pirellulales bacterium]|nr:WYL domain-containing protein [Pirellulales bacterium]